jgi:hypothetical protein
MTWVIPKTVRAIFGAVLLGSLLWTAAMAQERKIYKYVDEKGNVVYSQTPQTTGTIVKKLDAAPAYSGRGGNSPSTSPYDNPRAYSQDRSQYQYQQAQQKRQQKIEEARSKRLADLQAECNRNRGTDCNNPETLRYIDSTKIPRGYPR